MTPLELYLLTFNCGRALIDPQLFGVHLLQAWPKDNAVNLPDIIAISLQEVAPIAYSFLGGSFLVPYLQRFEEAVASASASASEDKELGHVYETLIVRNVGMTVLMLFVKKEVKERVKWIQAGGCGVGVWEMGNKGGVGVRIGIDDKELTFVAMHLAPMEGSVKRRNEDWKNIVQDLVFENVSQDSVSPKAITSGENEPLLANSKPTVQDGHGIYKAQNIIFLAGDLNYRTSHEPPSKWSHHTYPQPQGFKQAGTAGSQLERLELQALLERDQLTAELAAERTLHGFTEQPIDFAPTYKYSIGDLAMAVEEPADRWTWSKHRWPSWCDRILYLPPAAVIPHVYNSLPLFPSSDHRGVALSVTIPAKSDSEHVAELDVREHPPFELSTDWRSRRSKARTLEIIVGIASYLALTYEGYAILVGIIGGAFGG
ncbi:DNase I-like protein [Venturia nashicola]|nr:DNase I-like protein [Venturia nashicola]